MGVIATLLAHEPRLARLRTAARDRYRFVPCEDWTSLTRACERGPVNVVVFDLYVDGRADFERVRQLRIRLPRAALVAYVDMTRERGKDMFDAGRCGIDVLVVAEETDTPQMLAALLDQAEARSVSSLLRPHLAGLRSVVRDSVMLSVTRAHERLTPDGLARLIAVSRRLLSKRLEGAELPPPHQLLTWGRLIVAASMLEDGSRSADGVASDSAQGQVTISTDTATHSARDGSITLHTAAAPPASSSTVHRKGAAQRSAQRTLAGRCVCASRIRATMAS
jgi:hypothetical protein